MTQPTVEIRMLGPLTVFTDGIEQDVSSSRQQRLLAMLLLADGAVVSADRLVDCLWTDSEKPPAHPKRALQTYISRLRSVIGSKTVSRHGAGYRLDPAGVRTDIGQLEELITRIASAEDDLDHQRVISLAADAADLVAGRVLGELADEPWALPTTARLEEQVLRIRECALHAAVEVGDEGVTADLEQFVRLQPLRERPRQQLARALYRDGRQADALRAIEDYRALLREETGLDIGPELADLELRILNHESDIAPRRPAQRVAGYELLDLVGEGTFGKIFRARQPTIDREVAIKVIRPEFANDPEFIQRFELEAQTVARLEHPHIVPLYDFWRDHDGAYLVMRFINGGTAEQKLMRAGAWSVSDVARLVDEVGGALAVAHQAGVVHRDIKPANVLIDSEGNHYLSDFGIAIVLQENQPSETVAGSPLYVSPEQVHRGTAAPASDVYAFGVMLYELLTGQIPFGDSGSLNVLYARKIHERLPSIRTDRPDLPAGLDLLIATATSPDPALRFASISELVLAFRSAIAVTIDPHTTSNGSLRPRQAAGETLVKLEISGRQPFKGLAAFDEADTSDFFGRRNLVDELDQHLERSRFLVVTGPSGSGKSSVVRAGLLPQRRTVGTFVAAFSPGSHPFEEIEVILHRLASRPIGHLTETLRSDDLALGSAIKQVLPSETAELLLVIDQFEELFTLTDEAEREQFLRSLAAAVRDPNSRLRVVATLRADFYDRPLENAAISSLVRRNTIAVSSLSSTELEQAISRPPAHVGVAVEPALIAELVGEVTGQPASLPLLQYVLTELFERRIGNEMTLEVYREIGGLVGALAHRADALIDALGPEREPEVRRLFTRLIALGEGTEDTRRRVLRRELSAVDPAIIDAYATARLLTLDRDPATREPTVEVAHEALIREWPLLRSWLNEDRDGLRIQRHLSAAAAGWEAAERTEAELYRGGRLEAAEEWSTLDPDGLSDLERDYLRASVDRREAQQREERARIHRLRRLLGTTAVIAMAALLAGVMAYQQWGVARDRAADAEVASGEAERSAQVASQREQDAVEAEAASAIRFLASEAGFRVQSDRQLGLLLAVEAFRRDEGGPTSIGALQRALTGLGPYLGMIDGEQPSAFVEWIDDRTLVAVGPTGVRVLDTESAKPEAVWDLPVKVFTVDPFDGALITHTTVSVAGQRAAFVSGDDPNLVIVLDLRDPSTQPRRIPHNRPVDGLELSPDGRLLATIDADDMLRLHDTAGGGLRWEVSAHPETFFAELNAGPDYLPNNFYLQPDATASFTTEKTHHHLLFSADGSEVVTQEGNLRRWSASTGQQVGQDLLLWRERPGVVGTRVVPAPLVTYLGDRVGDRLIVHDSGSIMLVDLRENRVLSTTMVPDTADAYGLAKIDTVRWTGGDEAWVLLTNGVMLTVDLTTGTVASPAIVTQLSFAADLALSPDGTRAAVASGQGIGVYALDGSRLIARGIPRADTQMGSISPDGMVLTQDYANGLEWFEPGQVYDLRFQVPRLMDRPDVLLVNHSAGDGSAFKAINRDYRLQLLDLATLEPLGPALSTGFTWSGQAVTTDNRLIAAGAGSEGILVFEVATGRRVAQLEQLGNLVASLSFNADGSRLAAASGDGAAMVWETDSWAVLDPELGEGGQSVISLRYSPDGRLLVTMDAEGGLALRDPETDEVRHRLAGSGSPNIADGLFFFADDGHYLVTAADGSARLWDLEAGVPIGDPFPNDQNNRISGTDGLPRLVTAVDGYRLVWDLDIATWDELACQAAGRNLTRKEWEQFAPSGDYRVTCEQWAAAPDIDTDRVRARTSESQDPELTPLEAQADEAAREVRQLLETGDVVATEALCEARSSELGEAWEGESELPNSPIAGNKFHRYWIIEDGLRLCAGKSFDQALERLTVAIDDPNSVCGGYPSPCATPRE